MTTFDVIIDKMAVLVRRLQRLRHTVLDMNYGVWFLHMKPRDNKVRSSTCTTKCTPQGRRLKILNWDTNRLICIVLYSICLTFALFQI